MKESYGGEVWARDRPRRLLEPGPGVFDSCATLAVPPVDGPPRGGGANGLSSAPGGLPIRTSTTSRVGHESTCGDLRRPAATRDDPGGPRKSGWEAAPGILEGPALPGLPAGKGSLPAWPMWPPRREDARRPDPPLSTVWSHRRPRCGLGRSGGPPRLRIARRAQGGHRGLRKSERLAHTSGHSPNPPPHSPGAARRPDRVNRAQRPRRFLHRGYEADAIGWDGGSANRRHGTAPYPG